MRRRTLLAGAVGLGTVGTAGCLTTLGIADRGAVTAKYIVRVSGTETGNVVYDATEGERFVAPEHREQFSPEGRLFVSEELHRQLSARYREIRYHLRHVLEDGTRFPQVGRGDFNSVGVGDVASLTYSESGKRATVVGVTKG
jgi:hypothetical protein